MTEDDLEAIWAPYRVELQRDIVSLSELYRSVKRVRPGIDWADARAATLDVVEYALNRDEAEAGQFVPPHAIRFEKWRMGPQHVRARIDREWNALGAGSEPHVGQIVWLRRPRSAVAG